MPNTGTPASNRSGSTCGAPGSYTLDGPPDRMIAAGSRASIAATGVSCGTSSEYTLASRTRRTDRKSVLGAEVDHEDGFGHLRSLLPARPGRARAGRHQ